MSNFKELKELINQQRMIDTFIKTVKVDTQSTSVEGKEGDNIFPSTEGQKDLAEILVSELKDRGLVDVKIMKENGWWATGTLPSNIDSEKPAIGLLAHLDTAEAVSGKDVKPIVHRNYSGGDLRNDNGDIILKESELKNYIGHSIITSDGTTLLGADDKAGIAEILEALSIYQDNPEIKHPTIKVAFTPDEETGEYISNFDIKAFGVDAAYTLDGGFPDEFEIETFNAFNLILEIEGYNVHPGYAKNKMINAVKIASEIVTNLPVEECPEKTDGHEGYYHAGDIRGNESKVIVKLILRDFDIEKAKDKVETVKNIIEQVKEKYSGCKIGIKGADKPVYCNMKYELDKHPEVVACGMAGIRKTTGTEAKTPPIRGGTDGSQLTLAGLPTPNLPIGGENFHAVNEFISVENMEMCVINVINTMTAWVE